MHQAKQALRYRLKDTHGNVMYIVALNQCSYLTNHNGTSLCFSYVADRNAMELQHAIEKAEAARFDGSPHGENYDKANRQILAAIYKYTRGVTVTCMQGDLTTDALDEPVTPAKKPQWVDLIQRTIDDHGTRMTATLLKEWEALMKQAGYPRI